MGTSGAYTGAGGKAGQQVANGLAGWAQSLPGSTGGGDSTPNSDQTADGENSATELPADGENSATELPSDVVSGLMGLLQPRPTRGGSSDGPGSGGGGISTGGSPRSGGSGRARAGSGRSLQRLASVGGRAAAGAYAFTRGDAEGLRSLGLDYTELRALDDPFEVTRRIVDAVCGQQADSTLEESEERYVAAEVADWVMVQGEDGELPDADDVARYAIAAIVTEILASELGAAMREGSVEIVDDAGDELREAAWVLAGQAELTTSGATADELTRAIETGVEKLREIYGGDS